MPHSTPAPLHLVPGHDAGEYWVTSSDRGKDGCWYHVQGVDARIPGSGRCSCPAGVHARRCSHLIAAHDLAHQHLLATLPAN